MGRWGSGKGRNRAQVGPCSHQEQRQDRPDPGVGCGERRPQLGAPPNLLLRMEGSARSCTFRARLPVSLAGRPLQDLSLEHLLPETNMCHAPVGPGQGQDTACGVTCSWSGGWVTVQDAVDPERRCIFLSSG